MSLFADAIQRGDRASQPVASAVVVGTVYYVTDENVTERSSGSAWEDISDAGSGSATLGDGDYGDVTVSSSGTVLTIDNDVVTYAKMQNASATKRILLRKTAGSGDYEEGTIEDALNFIASLASGDLLYHDGSTFVRLAKGTTGQRLKTGTPPSWVDQIRVVKFTFDGGASTPSANSKARITCPVAGTIVRARIYADQSGSAVVDVWKDTWANYPPTSGDSITASAKPTLSSATNAEDTTLTGWTTAVSAGDSFIANLDSVTTCTQVNVELWIKES